MVQDIPPFGDNKTFAGQDGPDGGHKTASNIGGAIRFASNKRDDISTDYLRRATIRRDVVIEPLMQQIGELWSNGDLRIANEHMATSVIRSFIGGLENTTLSSPKGPAIVVATPAGEWHEIGALLVSLTAAGAGWSVVYLGANLPAEEIAAVALEHRARAVALSLIYSDKGDHHLGAELRKLRRALGAETAILVGGRGAQQNLDILDGIKAEILTSLDGLGTRLESLNSLPAS